MRKNVCNRERWLVNGCRGCLEHARGSLCCNFNFIQAWNQCEYSDNQEKLAKNGGKE